MVRVVMFLIVELPSAGFLINLRTFAAQIAVDLLAQIQGPQKDQGTGGVHRGGLRIDSALDRSRAPGRPVEGEPDLAFPLPIDEPERVEYRKVEQGSLGA